jgi:hypothetical protein
MNRHERRKANAQERKTGLSKDCEVEEIDLSDPNLSREHRDRFIAAIKSAVASLDEAIGFWYRHHDQCTIEGCDCGGEELAEQAMALCNHLLFIKDTWGEAIIDDHPSFARFVKEGDQVGGAYELLAREQRLS